ncbi:MAG TPA: hypothetical protein VNW30_05285 [Opitutaceae bacterium]|jgi:hypothetical protein|nr:hypothetical protein [Opitutaceae bacterium]
MSYQPNLAAWIEWRELCALGQCCDKTKADLSSWAKIAAHRHWSGTLNDQLDWAWHLLETKFVLRGLAGAKELKIRMFEVAASVDDDQGRLRVLENYASKVLFTALRDCAVKETWGRRDAVSGFTRVSIERIDLPDAPSLEEMLAPADFRGLHPASAASFEELSHIAQGEAEEWLSAMPHREKVALGAFFTDRSLTAPDVVKMADCEKSQLYAAKGTAVRRLVDALETKYAAENDPIMVNELTSLVLRYLGEKCGKIFDSGKPDGT